MAHQAHASIRGGADNTVMLSALSLYAVVMLVYLPTLSFPFVTVDDPAYIYENPNVYSGLSWSNVAWAFTSLHGNISYWHPVTWLSHQLDCQLFGFNAGPHHLTNVLLHVVNSVLVFSLARKLGLGIYRSLFVAAIFAVHPLHVESVAWVAERKDVLCGLFYLGTLNLYIDFHRTRRTAFYLGSLACGALALMSKPVAVTLPVVIILLHWHLEGYGKSGLNVKVLGRCVPFAMGSIALAVVTVIAQQRVGTLGSLNVLPIAERLDNMWLAYLAYVRRFLWPTSLCVAYGFDPAVGRYGIFALLPLVTVTVLMWRFRLRIPLAFFGWLAFLIMLLPAIGLVQAGPQSSADRYMYLPLLGLCFVIVDLLGVLKDSAESKPVWGVLGAAACVALALASMSQVMRWRDSVTLFSRAVDVQPHFWFARLGLGTALTSVGRFDEARDHLQRALKMPGNPAETYRILGVCMFGKRRYAEALENLRRSYELNPTSSAGLMLAHLYSGQDDSSLRNPTFAMRFALEALRVIPNPDGKTLLVAAAAHAAGAQTDKAVQYADRALEQGKRTADTIMMGEARRRRRAYQCLAAKEASSSSPASGQDQR